MDSASELWLGLGPMTRLFLVLFPSFHALTFVASPSFVEQVCLVPTRLVAEPWRFLLFPLFHASLFHLLANLASWYQVAKTLEETRGTLFLAYMTFGTSIVSSALLVVVLLLLHLQQCVIGFSGCLFALYTIQLSLGGSHVNFFVFRVHRLLQPVLLLFLISWFVPNSSFLGHLCGIAAGHLFELGVLQIPQALESAESTWAIYIPGYSISKHLDLPVYMEEGDHEQASPLANVRAALAPYWQNFMSWWNARRLSSPFGITNAPNVVEEDRDAPLSINLNAAVRQLLEMGFERNQALSALNRHNGNIEAAIADLAA